MVLIVILFITLLVLAFPFVAKDFQVVFVPSARKDLPDIKKTLALTGADTVYDLGCGTGSTLAYLTEGTGARGIGIELSPLWHRLAALRNRHNGRLAFRRANLFDVPLADATVVYCFLIPKAMPRLARKLKRELKPGTRILAYVFPFPDMEPAAVFRNSKGNVCAYLYRA